jgi:hypothetical protein
MPLERNDTRARRNFNRTRRASVEKNMRPVLLFLLSSMSVFAQPFSAGIKAGIPLTDFVNATQSGTFNYSSPTQRYIVGAMAEVRLPFGLGVEFDALYRHLQYTGAGTLVDILTSTSASAGSSRCC